MVVTLLSIIGFGVILAGAYLVHLGVFIMVIGLGLIRAASSLHGGDS